ncbi:MAG: ABC transporter ATP-binding protein [Saprospiraceae bacterium]|nr:ABC transporter ATP-binding protein [Saprospiraceae bacterium]
MYSIEALNLSHHFTKGDPVLDQINLQVRKGSIFGFLGPNGAGKTTTLRLILGLLTKQQGDIRLFGKSFEQHRAEVLRQIGSLIESPSIYGHLTAAENLLIWQKVYQCPQKRIPEVLELVGLSNTGAKKAGQFSLGMKQRLAIAVALLHEPALLILDEPTNGLDPGGIVEMRTLLKTLNESYGITILISSHLLSEIEKLVTEVGIINRGKMVFQGTLEALMERQQQAASLVFEVNRAEQALNIIASHHPTAILAQGRLKLPAMSNEKTAAITRLLVTEGIDIYGITRGDNDLETIFMNITNN